MFKSAATKLAHNSTLPALAGNRDLRPLQDLITTEKAVLTSLQRLSGDLIKSSDCLRAWGSGEGDDLQDVLSASTTLLGYVASALAQLALHEATIREHMKAVRTQEESLDELRKRRKTLSAKADAADRKLIKMSTENKSFQQQTELLNGLREQIRNLDWEILTDEAKLGDFKRTQTKNWMALKFGGLLECAEKATIVGEMGKLVIEEIPLSHTEPGQSRPFYTGHEKVEKLLQESQRCVSEVDYDPNPAASSSPHAFSPAVATAPSNVDGLPSSPTQDSSAYLQDSINGAPGFDAGMTTDEFGGLSERPGSRGYGTMPMSMPSGPIRTSDDGSRMISGSLDSNTSRGPAAPGGSRYAAQFATFPSRKTSLAPSAVPPPPTNLGFQSFAADEGSSSFASEVANALAYAEQTRTPDMMGKSSLDGPTPSYEPKTWPNPAITDNGLPKGAAPPAERNPWETSPSQGIPESQVGHPSSSGLPQQYDDGTGNTSNVEEEESELAYASPPPAFSVLPKVNEAENHQSFPNAPYAPQTTQHAPDPSEDEDELNAAAAREVARELDALTFRPPPGPPPGHPENRTPSPLDPPAPPFGQQQTSPTAPVYGANLSTRPENGLYGSRPDIRGSSQTLHTDAYAQQSGGPGSPLSPSSSAPYSFGAARGPASASVPSNINIQAPSPIPSSYATPPEMPAAQPLRTGSPAGMVAPGTRTISASAFKRPQMRTPSGGMSPMTPDGVRMLPDVTPLSLRKKSGLPSSPAPSHAREPASADEQSPQDRRSNDSVRQNEDGAYDAVDSYATRRENQEEPGSPGYGRGKFATDLEKDSLL